MNQMKKVYISLLVISIVLVILSYLWAIEFSSFSIGIAKYTIAIFLVWTIDKFAISEIDTLALVGKSPIAYSIFFFGNCVLAASCIANS